MHAWHHISTHHITSLYHVCEMQIKEKKKLSLIAQIHSMYFSISDFVLSVIFSAMMFLKYSKIRLRLRQRDSWTPFYFTLIFERQYQVQLPPPHFNILQLPPSTSKYLPMPMTCTVPWLLNPATLGLTPIRISDLAGYGSYALKTQQVW